MKSGVPAGRVRTPARRAPSWLSALRWDRTRASRAAALAALSASLAALSAPGFDSQEPGRARAAEEREPSAPVLAADYAPDASCAECHAAIATSYASVSMSRATYPAAGAPVIEDFSAGAFYHEASRQHYEMLRRGERIFLRSFQLDPDGQPIHERLTEAHWIVGSGLRGRTYLHAAPSGELVELPVSWYSQERRWAMSPGFDRSDHHGFERPVTRDCLFCHAANPALPEDLAGFGSRDAFPSGLPGGLGCQRCHGPGAEHVRLAEDEAAELESVRAAIVNPAKLPRGRAEEVCLQCHLQPSSEFTSLLTRFERKSFDYRPGQPLSDYLVHIDAGSAAERAERFEINHHAYRLRQSKCYTESGGAFGCTSCHDPHEKPPAEERRAKYSALCLGCHAVADCSRERAPGAAEGAPAGEDCAGCHMPKRRPSDVPLALMTDHQIQRGPPDPRWLERPTRAVLPRGAVRELYPLGTPSSGASSPEAAERELYADIAALKDGEFGRLGAAGARAPRSGGTALGLRFYAGLAALRSGDASRAAEILAKLPELAPPSLFGLSNLGLAQAAAGELAVAEQSYRAALALDPRAAAAHMALGKLLFQRGELEAALPELEEAVRLEPLSAKAQLALGLAYSRAGRTADAIRCFREALSLAPELRGAHQSVARALAKSGALAEALRAGEHALTRLFEDAEISAELALIYLAGSDPSLRDPARGLAQAERATRAAPGAPEPALLLALGLLRAARFDEAALQALAARSMGGDLACALAVEALAELGRGKSERARELGPSVEFAARASAAARPELREALRLELERGLEVAGH